MENRVLEAIGRFSLLKSGEKITVALSGGADSMALLHAMLSLKDKLGISVSAAHLNHMIRGAEADRDEAFVKEQCKKLGVKLYCERSHIPALAQKEGIGTELAARKVRYEFLERVSEGLVATAHNANDNLETVIFNLTRGSGLDGLCGIPPKRGIFIRPLLLCTRAEIEKYCNSGNIPFVTDSTNLSDDYTRNKIRHTIVPKLLELNPSVENAVLRTVSALREDANALKTAAHKELKERLLPDGRLCLKDFELQEPSVAKRILKSYIEKNVLGISLESVHIESLYNISLNGGRTSLPKNYTALVCGERLLVQSCSESGEKKGHYKVDFTEKSYDFFNCTKKINNLLLNNSLDCDKIVGNLVVRTRRAGDSIRLKNRGCTKTLNKLYNEYHILTSERDILPVIADDLGVIWVCGIGVAQRCAVTDITKRIYIINAKREV